MEKINKNINSNMLEQKFQNRLTEKLRKLEEGFCEVRIMCMHKIIGGLALKKSDK